MNFHFKDKRVTGIVTVVPKNVAYFRDEIQNYAFPERSSLKLQKMLGLGSTAPDQASPEDIAKVTEYSRQHQPEVFRKVVADKPFFVRWLDKPLVAGLVGIIAGKLINKAFNHSENEG